MKSTNIELDFRLITYSVTRLLYLMLNYLSFCSFLLYLILPIDRIALNILPISRNL